MLQFRHCRFPGMNCFLASASSQNAVGPSAANHVSTPASNWCSWGGLCCSTEGLGAIKPMGYSGLRVYIYMVLILSLGSRLCGASKHLGVPWSGFHQHPNTIAPRCSCFPLSLGSSPWRSQSPPVRAKSRLPAPLDLHAVMQPCGMPAANWRVWVSVQPKESSKARGEAVMCCVTF